jgi:hypothetical protein
MGTSARRPRKSAAKPRSGTSSSKDSPPRKRRASARPKKPSDGTPISNTVPATDPRQSDPPPADAAAAGGGASEVEPVRAEAAETTVGDAPEPDRQPTTDFGTEPDSSAWPVLDPVAQWERDIVESTDDTVAMRPTSQAAGEPESDDGSPTAFGIGSGASRGSPSREPELDAPEGSEHADSPPPLRPERAWALALARQARGEQEPGQGPPGPPDHRDVPDEPDEPEVADPRNVSEPNEPAPRDEPEPPPVEFQPVPDQAETILDAGEAAVDDWPWEQSPARVAALPNRHDREQAWRPSLPPNWLAAAGLAIAVVSIGIVGAALVANGLTGREGAATMKVAATTDVPPTDGPSTDVPATGAPATTKLEDTFDALPMDSLPGADWVVSGGDGASVVALPTSVDRSIRVRSSIQGNAATACRSVPDATASSRISFDLLVGRPPPSTAAVVSLRSGERDLLTIAVDPSGSLTTIAGSGPAASSPAAGGVRPRAGWGRVEVRIDGPGGLIVWRAHDVSGAEVAGGDLEVTDLAGAPVEDVCFISPQGMPSGWIAIDDLIVEG